MFHVDTLDVKESHMARPVVNDDLWALMEPLLPPPKLRGHQYPGRKPIEH